MRFWMMMTRLTQKATVVAIDFGFVATKRTMLMNIKETATIRWHHGIRNILYHHV